MAQTADRETDHDPAGWAGVCNRRLEDGSFCHMPYWYAYVASTRMGKRMTSRDSGEEHVCRGPLAPPLVPKSRTSPSNAEGDDTHHGKDLDDMPSTAIPEADRALTPGETWYADYKGVRYFATIQDDGQVKVDGFDAFKGFSAAAKAITGAVRNGWAFFHKYDPDNPPPVEVVPAPPVRAPKEPRPLRAPKESSGRMRPTLESTSGEGKLEGELMRSKKQGTVLIDRRIAPWPPVETNFALYCMTHEYSHPADKRMPGESAMYHPETWCPSHQASQ